LVRKPDPDSNPGRPIYFPRKRKKLRILCFQKLFSSRRLLFLGGLRKIPMDSGILIKYLSTKQDSYPE
jgi:hypothetical protein